MYSSELINKDKVLKELKRLFSCVDVGLDERDYYSAIRDLSDDVIRCKNCKYSVIEHKCGITYYSCSINHDFYGLWKEVDSNDFCSDGEPKEYNE